MPCSKPCYEGGSGQCPFVENAPRTVQEIQALEVLKILEAHPKYSAEGSFSGFDLNLARTLCEDRGYDSEVVMELISVASIAAMKVVKEN